MNIATLSGRLHAVVTGGRKFTDGGRIEADLRALLPHGLVRVAEGASRGGGADDLAHEAWRKITGESTCRYPVDGRIDGNHRGAPLVRNVRMLDAERTLAERSHASALVVSLRNGPNLYVLAYPDAESRGTWHCVTEALRQNLTVALWHPWFDPTELLEERVEKKVGGIVCVENGTRFILARKAWAREGCMLALSNVLGSSPGGR